MQPRTAIAYPKTALKHGGDRRTLDGRGDGAIMTVKKPSLRERDDREVTPRDVARY